MPVPAASKHGRSKHAVKSADDRRSQRPSCVSRTHSVLGTAQVQRCSGSTGGTLGSASIPFLWIARVSKHRLSCLTALQAQEQKVSKGLQVSISTCSICPQTCRPYAAYILCLITGGLWLDLWLDRMLIWGFVLYGTGTSSCGHESFGCIGCCPARSHASCRSVQ